MALSKKALAAMKSILENRHHAWLAAEMAIIANTSQKTVYKVANDLLGKGILSKDRSGLHKLERPDELRLHLENITRRPEGRPYFAPDTPEYFARRIEDVTKERGLKHSFTGQLGLWAYHQHLQPVRAELYVEERRMKDWARVLENDNLCIPSPPSRASVIIIPTNDPYPFLRTSLIDGYRVPQFVQVYLDCIAYGARLAEGARYAWRIVYP